VWEFSNLLTTSYLQRDGSRRRKAKVDTKPDAMIASVVKEQVGEWAYKPDSVRTGKAKLLASREFALNHLFFDCYGDSIGSCLSGESH